MTLWMVITLAFSAFLALCGALAERGAAACGIARRFIWVVVVGLALTIPIIGGFGAQRTGQGRSGRAPVRASESGSESTFAYGAELDESMLISALAPSRRIASVVAYTRHADIVVMILWGFASLVSLAPIRRAAFAAPRSP
jgi:hypothetical protein